MFVAEIEVGVFVQGCTEGVSSRLPRYPKVTTRRGVHGRCRSPGGELEGTIRESAAELLQSVELFDVYEGDPLPAGKKSVAFALELMSREKTLTDAEIEAAVRPRGGGRGEGARRVVAKHAITDPGVTCEQQRGSTEPSTRVALPPGDAKSVETGLKALWESARRAADTIARLARREAGRFRRQSSGWRRNSCSSAGEAAQLRRQTPSRMPQRGTMGRRRASAICLRRG